jgi:hypothetical protein
MSDEPRRPPLLHYAFALACVGWGVWKFVQPADLDGRQTAWAVTMIVIGVLLFLLGLFLHFTKSEAEAADELDQLDRQLYGVPHRHKIVDERVILEYGADVEFYRRRRDELAALGFRHAGDYVDVTVDGAAPWMRAVIRTGIGEGGTTMSGVFDVRVRGLARVLQWVGLVPRVMKCTEFETEFSDGTFATTGDAVEAAKTLAFPGISRVFLPPGTPVAAMLEEHRAHLRRRMDAAPGVEPLRVVNFADLAASQDRMQALKGNFRLSSEYDPAAEYEKISGGPLGEEEQRVAEEVARRRRG